MKLKRIMASILAICMVLSTMSFNVFATDEDSNVITVNSQETFQAALDEAQDGDVIEISAGEFTFVDATSITIDKAITIKGAGKGETILNFDSATSAFVITSSDVAFSDMTITQGTKDNSFHISISKGAWDAPAVQYSNVTIKNINFVGGKYSLCLIGENVVVDSCEFTKQDSHNIIIYSVKGESKITNNIFNPSTSTKTNRAAIYYEGGADNATDLSSFIGGGTLTIDGNEAYSKGLFFQFTNWNLVKDMNVSITNNKIDAFTNKAITLYDMDGTIIPAGYEFNSVVISENVFTNVPSDKPIVREYTGTVEVDASKNYLGSAKPDVESLIVGDKTIVESYYSDEACETLVTISDEVGTETDSILINTADDLIALRDAVNNGNNYAGKYVKLNADIDLSSVDNWTPIGASTYNKKYVPVDPSVVFSGTFDGNGKVISNLKIEKTLGEGSDADANVGLFGIIGEGAIIKDLTITNVNITTDGRNVGALAGVAHKATLENITVNGDIQISGGNNVCGVCAMTRHYDVSATDITVSGADGSAITGNNIVGGIFAEIAPNGSNQTFENLSVENVAINGAGGVGGILGLLSDGSISDVSVKNVELVGNTAYQGDAMGRIRLGSVAGLLGGSIVTISDVDVENVTAKNLVGNNVVLPVVGANYDASSNATEAKIGDTYYATLAKAFAAAEEGDTVTLLCDIENVIEIPTGVIIDANGYKCVQDRGAWGGIDWTLDFSGTLTIAPTAGTPVNDPNAASRTYEVGEWREAVIYDSKGEGIDIGGWPYDRSLVKKLVIEEGVTSIGSFTAQGFTNLTGEVVIPSTVTYIGQEAFKGSTFTKLTFAEGGTEELCIAQGAFKNLIIEEVSLPEDRPVHIHAWVFNNCHNLKSATLPATLVSVHGTNHIDYFKDFNAHSNPTWTKSSEIFAYNENMETITFGSEEVRDMFYANNNGTSKDYLVAITGLTAYDDFKTAFNAAQDGDTVKLVKNASLNEAITNNKKITLDLNGCTLTYNSTVQGEAMITNKGELTIKDSGENGTINYNYTGEADPSYGKGNYTISNAGTLTVDGGKITIANLSSHAKYPIDNNSTTGDAILVVNGGHLYNYNTSAIRQFCNSTTNKNSVTINGGLIEGYCAIWMQNPGSNTVNGSLSITGGEIKTTAKAYVNGTSELKDVASHIYCTIAGAEGAWNDGSSVSITGGTINENVNLAENTPEAITIGDAAIFNGYLELPEKGFKGSGTEEDPYLINNLEELILFRDSVNTYASDGSNQYKGKYVKLTTDIDLDGINWTPIGTNSVGDHMAFLGTFDGDGHTIKNLYINADGDHLGFFARTGSYYETEKAVVKNLNFENVDVSTNVTYHWTAGHGDYVGGVIANAGGNTYVENVHVTGYVYVAGCAYVGGIVGHGYPKIDKSSVKAEDGSYLHSGYWSVGGILGYGGEGGTKITNCEVSGLDIWGAYGAAAAILGNARTGVVGENLTAKNVTISGDDYALGYIFGNDGDNLTNVTCENVKIPEGAEPSDAVAAIGSAIYFDLQSAIDAVEEDETITVLRDVTVTTPAYGENALNYAKAVNCTIDLNGKTVSADTGNSVLRFNIANSGATSDVTVTVKNGKVVSGANTWCALMASGVDGAKAILNIENVKVENSKAGDFAVKAWGNSVINAKNVDITSSYGGGFYAVGGEIVLDDCTAVQTGLYTAPYLSMAFGVSNNGKMTIKSGDYSAAPTAIADGNNQGQSHGSWVGGVMNSGGTLIINGGTFANDNFGDNSLATAARGLICVDTGAILEINGGTFDALKGIIDYQNNLGDALKNPVTVIKGGTYSANPESDWVKVAEDFEIKANEDGTYGVQKNANLILTIEELKAFRDAVNTGNTYKGVTVKLGADIDLAGEEWTPIGNSTNKFQGTFDGQNYTISNLVITGNKSDVGLFGFTTDGEVKNLTVNNAKVSGRLNVGVVAGTPYTSKYTNIAVTGHVEINGMSYVGGVFGKNVYADVTGVTVDVDETSYVKATSTENGKAYRTYVGGVIGFMGEGGHTVSDVTSNINVTGDVCDIGGIVGIAHYGNNFKNITCTATVTNTNQDAVDAAETGGIAGVWHNGGAAVTFDEVYFDGKVVAAGVAENAVLGAAYSASGSGDKTVENEKVAKIGTTKYDTLSNAISAAQSGDTVVIIADGTYALPAFDNNITIEAAGGIEATFTVNKTKVTEATFNNVTFKYATTSSYNGIQHSTKLTYNNCTFEGQVFLYAAEETFNNCTFNTTDANNYNVWTYSAAKVDFNNCTFNSAGKSVHVYNEGATATDLTVKGCTFTASQAVEGKAAIEIDTTAMPDGTDIVIKNSTAEGFAAGSVSGNSLWNDKKNQTDLTVTVDDAQVWPVVARIGEVGYATLQEALAAVTSGATVDIVSDITITEDWDNRYTGAKITVPVTINGNGKTIKFTGAVADGGNYHSVFRFESDANVSNLTIDMSKAVAVSNRFRAISSKGDLTVDGCNFIGNEAYTNTRGIIVGEGAGAAIGEVDVKITNSTFTNWRRGVIDNENAQDAGTVEITGNTFTNSNVSVSANTSVIFTGNTMNNSWVNITSYASDVLDVVAKDNILAENDLANGKGNYISEYATVNAQEGFLLPIAKIGTKGYFSLQSAVDAANAGDTVMLVSNIALTESVNVAADDVITLDLAGYTITGTDTTQKNFGLINVNKGNLTVKDSGGTGKITLTATTDSGWNRYSAVIANNQGILTVESGKIEHLGGTAMAYGIDNLTNGNIGDATAVINGGTINSTYRGIRQFANSATCVNSLTITGGTVSGTNKAVWLQSSNKNANKGELIITGGTVADVYIYAPEGGDVSALTLRAKEANVANVINGLTSGYTVEKGNGVWTISKAVASLTDAEGNVTNYSSLAAAVAATELTGGTITLLADIETDEVLKINGTKKVTIEGQGHTVKGNAKNIFEVYSTAAVFNNINIINTSAYGRCINTRVDNVHITVKEAKLVATGVNSQPITVGGDNTNPNRTAHLNVQNSIITAGDSGYGIIVFQEGAEVNITNTQITGYAALYLKPESKGSTVTVGGKSVLTGNNYNNNATNAFGTVVFETSDVAMTVAPYATIVSNNYGDQSQSAFELNGNLNTITMEGKVVINGNNAFVLGGFVYDANYPITVADALVDALKAEGYTVESNIVTDINNITLTTESVIVRGITAIGKTGTLVLASYDMDGRLTDVVLTKVTSDTVIELSDTGLELSDTVKASLLSSMSTLTPLCDAVSIVIE